MKHNKRAQRLLAALCCTALLAGWGGLEAFAKEAPALISAGLFSAVYGETDSSGGTVSSAE